MSIYCFDKGMSMYATKAVGGHHFSVASDEDALAFAHYSF